MTENFEQGVKFIFAEPGAVPVPHLETPEFISFSEGMAFAARVRLVIDMMKPEKPETQHDVPKVIAFYVVCDGVPFGRFHQESDYADAYAFHNAIAGHAANPDYRVYPVKLSTEFKK